MNPRTGDYAGERRRQAQVFVFALLAHRDQATIHPLDVRQWTFFVLPTAVLDARCPKQRSIGLNALCKLGAPGGGVARDRAGRGERAARSRERRGRGLG